MKEIIIRALIGSLAIIIAAGFFIRQYYLNMSFVDEPPLTGVVKTTELSVNGQTRSLDYYMPAAQAAGRPLLFVLHGSKGTGRDMRKITGYQFDQLADTEGLVVVYPNGYDKHWNDCRGSANYAANVENIDDIQFFAAMIDYFADNYQIDRSRVYATGYSNGGHMAYRLAFEMPESFAAVAPIAANIPVEQNFDCKKKGQPVSVAIFNGTEDPVNPYNGGVVEVFGDKSRGEVLSSTASAAYWGGLAGLKSEPVLTEYPEVDGDPNTRVFMASWKGGGDVEVRLYTLQGSGHVVPSRTVKFGHFFGGSAGDIDAAEEVWAFFNRANAPAAE